MHEAIKATKPNVANVIIQPLHYNKDLDDVKDKEGLPRIPDVHASHKATKSNIKGAKMMQPVKPTVKPRKNFPPLSNRAVSAKFLPKAKPEKKAILSASEEADQYIRDLGL